MKFTSRKKGFSLIEVMVIVIVMGILAAVAVPKIFSYMEKTNRKIDATNALEMANIFKRAYQTEIIKFPDWDDHNKLSGSSMTLTAVVSNEGVNYYSGSGFVLVNGQTWETDKANYGEAFGRIKQLFADAGFTDVKIYAKNTDGGWACYGVILYYDGSTRIFSSNNVSKCKSGNNHENMVKEATKSTTANPIANYLPYGVTSN